MSNCPITNSITDGLAEDEAQARVERVINRLRVDGAFRKAVLAVESNTGSGKITMIYSSGGRLLSVAAELLWQAGS